MKIKNHKMFPKYKLNRYKALDHLLSPSIFSAKEVRKTCLNFANFLQPSLFAELGNTALQQLSQFDA